MINKYKFQLFIISILSIIFAYERKEITSMNTMEKATFGAGCFWCVEAVFERLDGVIEVEAGYTGGRTKNPTYKEVCSGNSGHAEVIQITYNPDLINYAKLLDIFWISHDPTTLNKQGADVGTQYRSVIFYHNENQKKIAQKSLVEIDQSDKFNSSIVTKLESLGDYYPAEEYHQDYFRLNSQAPYCQLVIRPKLNKIFNK